eukprot:TRINITY_DN32464_c0_g1_i1.p1 TRINITY_DN32464_c0_g1~~TRINITY_DN32464_c0_g1_i1.p1  ORF type:complete len:504 (+),score=54.11 TRINITY_DN32464_c0_g1_i1:34-1545(+)
MNTAQTRLQAVVYRTDVLQVPSPPSDQRVRELKRSVHKWWSERWFLPFVHIPKAKWESLVYVPVYLYDVKLRVSYEDPPDAPLVLHTNMHEKRPVYSESRFYDLKFTTLPVLALKEGDLRRLLEESGGFDCADWQTIPRRGVLPFKSGKNVDPEPQPWMSNAVFRPQPEKGSFKLTGPLDDTTVMPFPLPSILQNIKQEQQEKEEAIAIANGTNTSSSSDTDDIKLDSECPQTIMRHQMTPQRAFDDFCLSRIREIETARINEKLYGTPYPSRWRGPSARVRIQLHEKPRACAGFIPVYITLYQARGKRQILNVANPWASDDIINPEVVGDRPYSVAKVGLVAHLPMWLLIGAWWAYRRKRGLGLPGNAGTGPSAEYWEQHWKEPYRHHYYNHNNHWKGEWGYGGRAAPKDKSFRGGPSAETIRRSTRALARRKKYYRVLDASPGATHAELKAAYRLKALQHHPDTNKEGNASDEGFKAVNEAWACLGDARERAAYDNDPTRD